MDTTITLLKTLFQASLGGTIKNYYIGDPVLIPESALPCIAISPEQTITTFADSARDQREHTISIALIIDARKYFNSMPNEMVGTRYLMETMSKEDADGTINGNSLLGILRANLTLSSNRMIDADTTIDYTLRRRTEELITLEAVATVKVIHISSRT